MKIGLIVAMDIEAGVIRQVLGDAEKISDKSQFKIEKYYFSDVEIVMIISGIGVIRAAAATEKIISELKCDIVINYGFCGGLQDDIKKYDVCVIDEIIWYDFDFSEIIAECSINYPYKISVSGLSEKSSLKKISEIKYVKCASGGKVAISDESRERLKYENSSICDMESAAVAEIAGIYKVPVILIKTVSDTIAEEGVVFYEKFSKDRMKYTLKTLTAVLNSCLSL